MAEKQSVLLFNRNSAGEIDDSELVDNYDRQYEKVKKKAKAKLPPIDSELSDLSLNEKECIEKPKKNKSKKKHDSKKQYNNFNRHFEEDDTSLPPPPPPPGFFKNLPTTEREALTSMLMSYYMSGFHTGYYLGIKKNINED